MKYQYKDEKGEHLHELDGKPLLGTSTVVGEVIAKQLTWWASGMALKPLGWTNPNPKNGDYVPRDEGIEEAQRVRFSLPSGEEWYDLLQKCYRAHQDTLKSSADKGTDLHALLEIYVKECIDKNQGIPREHNPLSPIKPFVDWSLENVEEFLWSEANCYSSRLWVGGISDAGAVLKDGKTAVIDFKSAKQAYFSHFIQAAGYAIQLEESGCVTKNGKKVKDISKTDALIVVPFGSKKVEPKVVYDIDGYKKGFEDVVSIYKLMQSFNS